MDQTVDDTETVELNGITSPMEVMDDTGLSDHVQSPAEAPDKAVSPGQEILSSVVEVPNTHELEVLNEPGSSDPIPSPAERTEKTEAEPESRKIASSAVVLSGPDLGLLNKPVMSDDHISSAAEEPNKPKATEAKIQSSADVLSTLKSAENEIPSPAEESNKPDPTEKKAATPAGAPKTKRKARRSKGKGKFLKKSLGGNSLEDSKGASSSQNNVNGKRLRNESNNNTEEGVKKARLRRNKKLKNADEQTDKSQQEQKNNGKMDEAEKSQQENTKKLNGQGKKEKLGGLIFMCSGKTKPDCFKYRVMGVSMGKKDTVLAVKPGTKLFLYDFDLKLLYGIYKASSSGALKVEPKAFGGAFPAQVRFTVEKDCLPLPENLFKKAIKENYDEKKKKFKTELTLRQVRKLTSLFRPAQVHSSSLPTRSPLRADTRVRESRRGRAREPLPVSRRDARARDPYPNGRDARARDPYPNGDGRSYPVLGHEREQHAAYRDVASSRREEMPRHLHLSEKEYRAYGLQGERRNPAPHIVSPAVEVQHRDYERDQFVRQPNLYREAAPAHRETVRSGLYMTEKEYSDYTGAARHELPPATSASAVDLYARDPYPTHYSYYRASSLDQYAAQRREEAQAPLGSYFTGTRRESYLVETDNLQRRAPDRVGRSLYFSHAAAAIDDRVERSIYSAHDAGYDRLERSLYSGRSADDRTGRSIYSARAASALDVDSLTRSEALPAPVSSRYAFAGASYSYR